MQNVEKIEYDSIAKKIIFVLDIISLVEAQSTVNIQDLVNRLEFTVNACSPLENFEWSIPPGITPNSLTPNSSGLFSNFEGVNHGKLAFSNCFGNTLVSVFIPFYNEAELEIVYYVSVYAGTFFTICKKHRALPKNSSKFDKFCPIFEVRTKKKVLRFPIAPFGAPIKRPLALWPLKPLENLKFWTVGALKRLCPCALHSSTPKEKSLQRYDSRQFVTTGN